MVISEVKGEAFIGVTKEVENSIMRDDNRHCPKGLRHS